MDRKAMPLSAYAATLGIFNLLLGRLIFRDRVNRLTMRDMMLLGVATHKLSRMVTKDLVTTPFRAPFTEFQGFLGYGECQEKAREETPLQLTLGELLSCNYCADPWIALALLYMMERTPQKARLFCEFLSSIAVADFLHVAYESSRTRANVLTLREEKLERLERKAA